MVGAAFAVGARRQVRDLGSARLVGRCTVRHSPVPAGPGMRPRHRRLPARGRRRDGNLPGLDPGVRSDPSREGVDRRPVRRGVARDPRPRLGHRHRCGPGAGVEHQSGPPRSPRWRVGSRSGVVSPRPIVEILSCSGLGVAVLALAGLWISSAFSTSRDESVAVSPLPVALAGLGFLTLAAGVVWMSPYAVRRIAALGRLLPLSGRYSFRDSGPAPVPDRCCGDRLDGHGRGRGAGGLRRHRGCCRPARRELDATAFADREQLHAIGGRPGAVLATVERILGPVEMYASDGVRGHKGRYADLWLSLPREGSTGVGVVDEETLRYFVPAKDVDL